jgi:flagellar hook protein FlgE
MLTAFSTALSALSADTTAIDVVGNNLANLNTIGFKDSSVSFNDLMSQALGASTGSSQVGLGVGAPITKTQFTQGAINSTGNPLDAAIQGQGFFVITTPAGANEYTRAGNFQVDSAGNLTTATNELVQGWSLKGGTLTTSGPIGPINVPAGTLAPPLPTQNTSVSLNLDASAAAGTTFSTSVQIYDSLGTAHTVTYTFTQSGTPNQWTYSVGIPAGDTTPAATPTTGTLTFNSNGDLISPAAGAPPVIAITGLNDGASAMNVNWNLYSNGVADITQFAQPSATSAQSQDGSAAASLISVGISNGGQILAQYSNGQQVVAGQLAMASISNPATLVEVGDNAYQTSAATALPSIGLPGTGGRGTVLGGSLESSTVDMATEFTNLIVYQRGYEANAHVITTVDQLSQDTINLKQ